MAQQIQRNIAFKCRISDLTNGNFVKKEGFESSYIETNFGNISRVNIIAAVVFKNENSVIIDDGSNKISVRFFDNIDLLQSIDSGDIILAIGKPRIFNNELFIVPEIIKKVNDKKWIELRKIELQKNKFTEKISKVKETKPVEEKKDIKDMFDENKNTAEFIIRKIREMDKGDGVYIDDLIKILNIKNSEDKINTLLQQGDIFEIKPGRIKVLE